MNNNEAEELFDKYLDGNCNSEESMSVNRAYNKEIPEDIEEISEQSYREMKANMWKYLEHVDRSRIKKYHLWHKFVAAAILLVIATTGLYLFSVNKKLPRGKIDSVHVSEIIAGSNKTVLTLENGKKINLSNSRPGVEFKSSELTYTDGTPIENFNLIGNEISTISTPRGGQYSIQLSDGTKVLLNAASTLKFPASFSGLVNRIVELSGEGYFEVAKDKKHPFIVKSVGQEVSVLGTQFNINCYADETSEKTTLIEGSVKISSRGGKKNDTKLKPGQQAELTNNTLAVSNVNIEKVLAWKSGDFVFKNEDLKSVMRELCRWYDVDVEYQPGIPNVRFSGIVARSKNLSAVLEMLASTGQVEFKIEGRRITIMR